MKSEADFGFYMYVCYDRPLVTLICIPKTNKQKFGHVLEFGHRMGLLRKYKVFLFGSWVSTWNYLHWSVRMMHTAPVPRCASLTCVQVWVCAGW